jgi:hypothetical protein
MNDDDLVIDIEGIGEFRYAQRTMLDTINIRRRFIELAGPGQSGDAALDILCDMIAVHEALLVSCPKGFEDLANIKANDVVGAENADTIVFRLYSAFSAKEGEFRQEQAKDSKSQGSGSKQKV